MDRGLVYGCLLPHPPILIPAIAGSRAEAVRSTRDAVQAVADEILELSPDVVLLISPHSPRHPHAVGVVSARRYVGDFGDFGHPDASVIASGDQTLASAISEECDAKGVSLAALGGAETDHTLDHGAAVPLYFLQQAGLLCPLLLLAPSAKGAASHAALGAALSAAALSAGRRAVLVASGDLSHRLSPGAPAGFDPRGMEFDRHVVSALARNDWGAILEIDSALLSSAGECGYSPLVTALGAMEGCVSEVLSYEGPFGVGYLVARFRAGEVGGGARRSEGEASAHMGLTDDERAALRLARRAVEEYVQCGAPPALPAPPPAGLLAARAGVFVCLKVDGQLRGCVGTFQPTEQTVAAEIVRSAVLAAARDPRFPCVTARELPRLQYSIDILSPPEPVEDSSQLDPRRYGILLESGRRRALLLPDLPGVDTVESQMDMARRKAGIPMDEAVHICRFTVHRIEERAGLAGGLT
jgi:MEMO1 family protein